MQYPSDCAVAMKLAQVDATPPVCAAKHRPLSRVAKSVGQHDVSVEHASAEAAPGDAHWVGQ